MYLNKDQLSKALKAEEDIDKAKNRECYEEYLRTMAEVEQGRQDDIQENTDSMEEKLEQLGGE